MKNTNKLKLLSLLATSTLVASDISINSIGLNIGTSNSSYTQTNHSGSIILGNEPNKSFNTIEAYATLNPISNICKEYNMKPYISYTYSTNTDLKHRYLLTGVNKYYKLKDTKVKLNTGLAVGYGQINWKYDPLNNSKDTNVDANSFIAAIQLGLNYPLNKKFSIGLNSKYLIHNYETNLNPSVGVSSTIKHKNTISVMFGVEYGF